MKSSEHQRRVPAIHATGSHRRHLLQRLLDDDEGNRRQNRRIKVLGVVELVVDGVNHGVLVLDLLDH